MLRILAERHTLDAGTTVAQFLDARSVKADNCTIRVVRTGQGGFTPTADEAFQEGDRLSDFGFSIADFRFRRQAGSQREAKPNAP